MIEQKADLEQRYIGLLEKRIAQLEKQLAPASSPEEVGLNSLEVEMILAKVSFTDTSRQYGIYGDRTCVPGLCWRREEGDG